MTADKNKPFSEDELEIMREVAKERRSGKTEGEGAVLAKIEEMSEPDKSMSKRIHEIVKETAPQLAPKTWYGMPAYADKNGKVVCFFKAASKYNSRYATLGFEEAANLDDGNMWVTSFALEKLTAAEETKIKEFVKKAVS